MDGRNSAISSPIPKWQPSSPKTRNSAASSARSPTCSASAATRSRPYTRQSRPNRRNRHCLRLRNRLTRNRQRPTFPMTLRQSRKPHKANLLLAQRRLTPRRMIPRRTLNVIAFARSKRYVYATNNLGNSTPPHAKRAGENLQNPWRMGWDSNPRYAFTHGGFQDRYLKPLGHPSTKGGAPSCDQSAPPSICERLMRQCRPAPDI